MIAAGIRGLIVAGGSYTGPAMNPMIAFGWAVQSGAYKVRVFCKRDKEGGRGMFFLLMC